MNDNDFLQPEPAEPAPNGVTWVRRLGPGLITGAADDDPSGIGTYSQAGAQFGFELLWSLLLTYPLMTAIQLVSARIGRVTGKGLASNMRKHYPPWLLYGTVVLLITANVINIAADLSAMGAAVNLLLPGPQQFYIVCLGGVSVALQVFVPYDRYSRLLKWTALTLLAYVAVALIVPVSWAEVGRAIVQPHAQLSAAYLTTLVAVLGTTISPYLFFWQASQEVEELRAVPDARPLRRMPRQAPAQLRRISFDTWFGMGVSNVIAFFIVLTAAPRSTRITSTSRRRRMPRGRSSRLPVTSRTCCLRLASSAPACWHCRCSRDRPPTRPRVRSAGATVSRCSGASRRNSMR